MRTWLTVLASQNKRDLGVWCGGYPVWGDHYAVGVTGGGFWHVICFKKSCGQRVGKYAVRDLVVDQLSTPVCHRN